MICKIKKNKEIMYIKEMRITKMITGNNKLIGLIKTKINKFRIILYQIKILIKPISKQMIFNNNN
jgi:hypothetical protein